MIVFTASTMISALKKNPSVVCQTTVQRIRDVVIGTSGVENDVALVNEK